MNFSFIHAADIHLDSPLRGLERYEGAPVEEMRGATRKAFENLCDLCLAKAVDFLVISGDIYDIEWKDYQTGLFFANQLSRLRTGGIQVYLISGNHDAESEISRQVRLPDNVYKFAADQPETVFLDELQVAIHGWSYPTRAVTDDMSLQYPQPHPQYFNIGLLHTSLDGREGHAPYAPASAQYLQNKGYQYWALGHVHQREIVSEEPLIVFPGNIQGRHARETGSKGCVLVTVTDDQPEIKYCPLDVMQWREWVVDLTGILDLEQALRHIEKEITNLSLASNKLYAVRLQLTGPCKAHYQLQDQRAHFVNNIRSLVSDYGSNRIWLEKVIIKTKQPFDLMELLSEHPTLADFFDILNTLGRDQAIIEQVLSEVTYFRNSLPHEITAGEDPIDLTDQEYLAEILLQAKDLIIDHLADLEVD